MYKSACPSVIGPDCGIKVCYAILPKNKGIFCIKDYGIINDTIHFKDYRKMKFNALVQSC